MTEGSAHHTEAPGAPTEKINILFEEYRALYGLAEFRLASLDRRAMLAWAALGAFLSGFDALSTAAKLAFLLAVPMAVVWLVRTTINHARSFEDAISRIGEIECTINRLVGHDLLAFQSRHPSRGAVVGGRTGRESVFAVLITAAAVLLICGCFFERLTGSDWRVMPAYFAYLGAIVTACAHAVCTLRSYRYRRANEGATRE